VKKTFVILFGVLAAAVAGLIVLARAGLKLKPKPFPPYPGATPDLDTIELPDGLPAPVARFYKFTMGERVPVIESAILTARGTVRFAGLTFPARLRFTHAAGQAYRHYIEATVFGLPLMKVNETYLDGRARLELPFGVVENEPKVDMAANLGLWAESLWLPSIYITDPRVRWEAVDETTAHLIVPFGKEKEAFTATFDPQTGLIQTMEAMRYKEAKDEEKTLWRNELLGWQTFHGITIPVFASATWMDEGTPWLILEIEDVVYNADVTEYIRASGP
jgi:hypothetical protein